MSFGDVKKRATASDPMLGKVPGLDPPGDRVFAMTDTKSGAAHFGLPSAESGLGVESGDPVSATSEQMVEETAAPVIDTEQCGVAEAEAETGKAGSSEAEEPDRRRYERTTVLWTSRILFGDQAVDCVIINISAEGAMVQVSEKIEVGDSAIVKNERIGAFAGKVVWNSDSQIGMSFFDDPEEIALALGRVLP